MSVAEKYTTLTSEKIPKVYENGVADGRQAEYDRFWDAYQQNGNRTSYEGAFYGAGWTTELFKPKYSMSPAGSATYMFYMNLGSSDVDLTKWFNSLKITLDTSLVTNTYNMFSYCGASRIPELNLTSAATLNCTFRWCSRLISIDKIVLKDDGSQTFLNGVFDHCYLLENITLEGVVGNDINFQYSPLSVESMKSIISCLKDYSGTSSEFTKKLTLSSSCKTALEAEGTTSPNGNTWAEYAYDKCWTIE